MPVPCRVCIKRHVCGGVMLPRVWTPTCDDNLREVDLQPAQRFYERSAELRRESCSFFGRALAVTFVTALNPPRWCGAVPESIG